MSFLGFERSLFFSAHIFEAHFSTSSVFGVDGLFCLSPVLLFFETIPVYLHGGLFYGFSWLWRSFLTRDMHQSCSRRRRLSCWKLLSSVCFCFGFRSRLEHEGGLLYLIVCLRGDKIAAHNGWKSFNMLIGCLVCVVLFYSLPHQFGFWNGTTTLLGPPLRK